MGNLTNSDCGAPPTTSDPDQSSKWTAHHGINPYSDDWSVPLSFALSSQHPEHVVLINRLCHQYLPEYLPERREYREFGAYPRRELRIIILHLYLMWCRDERLFTAIPMGNDTAYGLKKYRFMDGQYPKIVRNLAAKGLVDLVPGYRDRTTGEGRTTRIRPTDKLRQLFLTARPFEQTIRRDRQETIIINNRDGERQTYKDTAKIIKARKAVDAVNDVLALHHVGLMNQTADAVYQRYWVKERSRFETRCVSTTQANKFMARVFNNRQLTLGGRYYGHWPGQIERELRPYIGIDGSYTVEWDYSSLHPALLYAQIGLEIRDDPYIIETDVVGLHSKDQQVVGWDRKASKITLLSAINAPDRDSAVLGAKSKIRKDTGINYAAEDIAICLDLLLVRNEPIRHLIHQDMGISLQAQDSRLAEMVMGVFTRQMKPIIPVHDSFIVKVEDEDLLLDAMETAYQSLFGWLPYKMDDDKSLLPRGMRQVIAQHGIRPGTVIKFEGKEFTPTGWYRGRVDRFFEQKLEYGNPDYRVERRSERKNTEKTHHCTTALLGENTHKALEMLR